MEGNIEKILKCEKYDIDALREIMAILRSENGCPWDREQTHKSIRQSFIEETYEAVDAIDTDDAALLCEELGDVLLQVVFHARIEEEAGDFTLDDVIDGIARKLVYRHPHVFGDKTAETSGDVIGIWEEAKKKEKTERCSVTDTMRAVPHSLPALMRAQKIAGRAAKAGFDFESAAEAMTKITEEAGEVDEALVLPENFDHIEEEIGDLLFAVTNVARLAGVDSEVALNRASEKFTNRFAEVENIAHSGGRKLENMTNDELLDAWNAAKRKNN